MSLHECYWCNGGGGALFQSRQSGLKTGRVESFGLKTGGVGSPTNSTEHKFEDIVIGNF